MNRLLYFTGYRMVAQEWDDSLLKNSVFFEPGEQGFDLFKTYLNSINYEPIRLLVDLIEEEFRQETIPFVRGADRKILVQRHLDKFFRNSKFSYAFSQSVEKKKKRKEEHLVFSGLTNPELIEPWLSAIKETKTALSGIVSLPIISERFVGQLSSKNKCVILVSQQVPSNLRQTVFVNGKLILSRLVPITSFYQGKYAEDVIRDVDSTHRYLVSQRLIERADTVTVHILSNSRHSDKLSIACAQVNYFDFEIHNINDLLAQRKIDVYEDQDFSSTLFCYETTKIRFVNHYARDEDKYYLKHYFVGLALKIIGIAVVSVGLGLGVTSAIQGYLFTDNIPTMDSLANQYDAQYERLSEKTKLLPISTTDMKKSVQIAAVVDNNYRHSPKTLLTKISKDLALFSDLRMTQISWFVADAEGRQNYGSVDWGGKKTNKRNRSRNSKKSKFKGYYEVVILNGEFIDFSGNYRYALSVLSDFEDLLKESGKYHSVNILKQPLNIAEDASLSGAVVDDKEKKVSKTATFIIKITTKEPLNV